MTKCVCCGSELPEKPKIKVFKGTDEQWESIADGLARSYCPEIIPCRHCQYPVVDGYVCQYCGSTDPGSYDDD
jgi:hypothetical protein